MITITDTSRHGTMLFIEAKDDAGRVNRYALNWETYESQGMSAVLAAITEAGKTPGQVPPAWVQQLVGQTVSV
jgi:hypothetical protein